MTMARPHPLDKLVQDDSLFLMEAMVPFVDYAYKKPLVMLIKYQEMNAILRCFDDPEYIASCGFDCHPKSSEDMIQSICNVMPGNYGSNIKQAMQMMSMMQTMQAMQEPAPRQNFSDGAAQHKNLYESVLSILDEEGA